MESVNKPKRKPVRSQHLNYSNNGVYFLTLCTFNHQKILSAISVGDGFPDVPKNANLTVGDGFPDVPDSNPDVCVHLTEIGQIVRNALEYIHQHNANVEIIKYVIMPNHIHLLVNVDSGTSRMPSPTDRMRNNRTNDIIPKFVSSLKRFTNKQTGRQIWQRTYTDRVIRDMRDFENHWQYIEENPLKWTLDKYY